VKVSPGDRPDLKKKQSFSALVRLHISGPLGIMKHKIYTSPSKELYLNYPQQSNHDLNYSQKHHTLSKVAYSFLVGYDIILGQEVRYFFNK